jgi:hypothetical protein
MRKIIRRDILGPALYEPIRDDFRKKIIERKKVRRVELGPRVSLVFDNREILRFQIEEILRSERITEEAKIQDEIDVYNSQLPSESELAATMFLEIPRDEDAREALHRLIGIDEHVTLVIGAHRVRARFEEGRQTEDKISAVQYTRFPLPAEAKAALRTTGTPVAIEIDHPNYPWRTELTEATRASLAGDFDEA